MTEVVSQHGTGATESGVLCHEDGNEVVKIRAWAKLSGCEVEVWLNGTDHIREDQVKGMKDAMEQVLSESLPVGLRGNVPVPTVSTLRQRAVAAARANGIDVPDTFVSAIQPL